MISCKMTLEQTYDDLSLIDKNLYDKVFVEARKGYRKGSAEVTKQLLENTSITSVQFGSQGVLMALRDAERAADLEKSLVEIKTEKEFTQSRKEPVLLMQPEVAEFYGLIKPKRRTDYAEAIQQFNRFLKGTGIPDFVLDSNARDARSYKQKGKVGLERNF